MKALAKPHQPNIQYRHPDKQGLFWGNIVFINKVSGYIPFAPFFSFKIHATNQS